MNKYRVIYGYCHPHALFSHLVRIRIFNTFDEAKKFIFNLPKSELRVGRHGEDGQREPSGLYAKIRAEKRDFWMYGNPEEIWMTNKYIGSNNPT